MRSGFEPRLLLDLAPLLSHADLVRAYHEARVRHRTSPQQVFACMQRNPRRAGAGRLRAALAGEVTLSPLEKGFLALLRAHRLPLPRTNIDRAGDKADCHRRQIGLSTFDRMPVNMRPPMGSATTKAPRRTPSRTTRSTGGGQAGGGSAGVVLEL